MTLLDRLAWLAAVNRHPGMTPAGRAVAIALAVRAKDGVCWPSIPTIAADCGLKPRATRYGIETLERAGFATVERGIVGERRDRQVNRYTLRDLHESAPRDEETTCTSLHPVERHDLHESAQTTCTRLPQEQEKGNREELPAPRARGGSASPDASRGKRSGKTANGGDAWKAWVDLHRESGLPEPVRVGADLKAGKELAKLIPDPADLRRILAAYLADADAFLAKQGHALRLLPGRVNAYLEADPAEKPHSPEAVARFEAMEEALARGEMPE